MNQFITDATLAMTGLIIGALAMLFFLSCQAIPHGIRAEMVMLEYAITGNVEPWRDKQHECVESGCVKYPIVMIRDGKKVK